MMFLLTTMSSTAQLVSNGASLKVDCLSTPTTPTALMTAAAYANGKMVLPLIGVPSSCSGVAPGAPCATRPMFQCVVDGAPPSPPMRALLEEQRASQGELLSLSPYLECPLPPDAVEGAGISVSFDSLTIPVLGPDSSVVRAIDVILGPPPPSPPPSAPPPAPPPFTCSPETAEVLNYRVRCKNRPSWCTTETNQISKDKGHGCAHDHHRFGVNGCCHNHARCVASLLDGHYRFDDNGGPWSSYDWITDPGWDTGDDTRATFDIELLPWKTEGAIQTRLESQTEAHARAGAQTTGKSYEITGISFWNQQESARRNIKSFFIYYSEDEFDLGTDTANSDMKELDWSELTMPDGSSPGADLIKRARNVATEDARILKKPITAKTLRFRIDKGWDTQSEHHGLVELQIKGCPM